MVIKTCHKKVHESYSLDASYQSSKGNPPWCSGKLTERRKLSPNWQIQSSYPLRENIWEYLHNGENLKKQSKRQNRKTNNNKKCCGKKTKLMLILLCMVGVMACLFYINPTHFFKVFNKTLAKTKMLTTWGNSSVNEECCHKMRHLTSELSRMHKIIRVYRNSLSISQRPTAKLDWVTNDYSDIIDLEVSIGKDTEEWNGQRVHLWGIIPLWQASPSPNVVLSLDKPRPGDCWPFSGRSGSLHMHLPGYLAIKTVSLEHVRPDTAQSAPQRFEVIGLRADGALLELVDSEYRRDGPAKQYFEVGIRDKVMEVILKVKSNQGNPTYTCIYRVQLYTSVKDYNEGFWNV